MSRALLAKIAAFAVSGGLSCAVGQTPESTPLNEAPAAEPPSARELRIARIQAEFSRYQSGLADFEARAAAEAIADEARRHGLDEELVLAVIRTESGFHNFARSSVGALGLMQLMPGTGEMLAGQAGIDWSGADTLLDPVANIELGIRYLAQLRARYGDWEHALAAYNWGPGAIDRRLASGAGLPQRYTTTVLAHLQSFAAATP
jgi:soluble lytic murein transglycosylase-like protein